MAEIEFTKDNFDEIINGDKPVLVDFWATWCGPCQMMGPVVEEIANEQDAVVVGKLNVDDEEELAQRFRVMSIPTFILFKNGEMVDKKIGGCTKAALLEFIGQ